MRVKTVLILFICFLSFSGVSQQLTEVILADWVEGSWENCMKQRPFYDEDGRILKKETAIWNADLTIWEDRTKVEYVRDDSGVLLNREEYKWLADVSKWDLNKRMSYSINEFSKPSRVLTEVHNDQGWHNQVVDEYAYDDNGNLIGKTSERWNQGLGRWVPNQKFIYSIEENRTMGYLIFIWSSKTSEWKNYKRSSYIYNSEKAIDRIAFDSWEDEKWVKQSIRRHVYSDVGVLSFSEVDDFEEASLKWEKSNHVDYNFTAFGKISESTSKVRNSQDDDWVNLQRSTYSYTKDGQMMEDWSHTTLELFPNPTQEKLTIRSLPAGEITVQDALGKTVLQMDNELPQIELDVSLWENGVYSVQVNGGEVQQFVKE